MIVLVNEQILTIYDAPYEDDAFRHIISYDVEWTKIILNKELKILDMLDLLLKLPNSIIKPNAELIKKADKLVERVICH